MPQLNSIAKLSAAQAAGETTAVQLLDDCLARISDPGGEGSRAFLKVYEDRARAEAEAIDTRRAAGVALGPLAGIPMSVKDLFDVAGETTTAGTRILAENPPAADDAVIVSRLRAAGAVIVGKNNMTELAYSGIGINSHYDTPRNPWDRQTGRVPGGSSSGAGVSVADGMAVGAIGTDTAGSVRIPAGVNGVTGFKPTASRVDQGGCYPLSKHLDSIGPLAPTVDCCLAIDGVISGEGPHTVTERAVGTLTLAVPQTIVLNDLDDEVAHAFDRACHALSAAGAQIVEFEFPELTEAVEAQAAYGTFQAAEAWAAHKELGETRTDEFDPLVMARMKAGQDMTATDFIRLVEARAGIIGRGNRRTAGYDAAILPSVALVAPAIQPLLDDFDLYVKTNILMLRNTGLGNFLDRCGFSIPIHGEGEAPVGLMVMGQTGGDHGLMGVARAVEQIVNVTTAA